MKIRNFFLIIGFLFLIVFTFNDRQISEPIENLAILSGIGNDIRKNVGNELEYVVPVSVYIFNEDKSITSKVYAGNATTISSTREVRQRKLDKRFIVGFEKVIVTSEEAAKAGIRPWVDSLSKSPWVNDNSYVIVCKSKAEDIIGMKIEGYASAADYLDGMIRSITSHDFFYKEYALINVMQNVDAEGKKTALPYIEVKDGQLTVTGIAIFKNDKMARRLDIKDTRLMNMMRNNDVYGIVDLQKSSKEYTGFEATVKRKVKCYKEGEKFKFIINLNITGNVINNLLYNGMISSPEIRHEFEEDLAKQIKSNCEYFTNKMKNEYKMDIINLSEAGIAKCGRHTGIDWDKAVSESEIEVNVKVNVNQQLRGDY